MATLQSKVELLRLARENEQKVRDGLEEANEKLNWWLSQSAIGRKIQADLNSNTEAKDAAKAATKEAYDEVRDLATVEAQNLVDTGKAPWGRTLHPNVMLKKKTQLEVIDLSKTVAWLVSMDKEETVTVNIHGHTGFFNNAVPLPGTFKVVKVPQVNVDKVIAPMPVPIDSTPADEHNYGLRKEKANRV